MKHSTSTKAYEMKNTKLVSQPFVRILPDTFSAGKHIVLFNTSVILQFSYL